ncbi:MAG: DUF192 domain-containing protein [bacterium]|nr:DUF192 domain-containing protein [bacterium]
MTMKNYFFLAVGLAVIAGSFYLVLQKPAPEKYSSPAVSIGNTTFAIEIADTEAERSKGLSGREALETGRGMLFIFPEPGPYAFWMKDMKFAIDIVWIDEALRVIGITRGVGPETFPQTFFPPGPVKYVMEVPAGAAEFIEPVRDMLQFKL